MKDLTVYRDRRLRDVEFVDYRRVGRAVVYVDGLAPRPEPVSVTIETGPFGKLRLVPEWFTVGRGGRVRVHNLDSVPHTLSCPGAQLLRRVEPSGAVEFTADPEGELSLYVLGAEEAEAQFFVSPGLHAAVSSDGRWELRDLPPGARVIHAWHSRFPPAVLPVTIVEGAVRRVDLELKVENAAGGVKE
jgi:hypothetical protein